VKVYLEASGCLRYGCALRSANYTLSPISTSMHPTCRAWYLTASSVGRSTRCPQSASTDQTTNANGADCTDLILQIYVCCGC
jgi:hypothetical protein